MYTTIFIHGTLPPKALLLIPAIHTFFYCPPGLHKAAALDKKYHHYKLAEILCRQDPARFNLDYFYFYGWSGKLSNKERESEAEKFFQAIKDMPRPLRIITYSHGGNIALQLDRIARHEGAEDFMIDELVLLACPVQRETKDLVAGPSFKLVYSIHSHHDILQVIDPQGLYEIAEVYEEAGLQKAFAYLQRMQTLFSDRHFPSSDNLLQLHVMLNNRDVWHIEFIFASFFSVFPQIFDRLESEDYERNNDELVMNFDLEHVPER